MESRRDLPFWGKDHTIISEFVVIPFDILILAVWPAVPGMLRQTVRVEIRRKLGQPRQCRRSAQRS